MRSSEAVSTDVEVRVHALELLVLRLLGVVRDALKGDRVVALARELDDFCRRSTRDATLEGGQASAFVRSRKRVQMTNSITRSSLSLDCDPLELWEAAERLLEVGRPYLTRDSPATRNSVRMSAAAACHPKMMGYPRVASADDKVSKSRQRGLEVGVA